ncbi:BofC N-terminal domain-containing protein [Jeotgalibacillus sp. ET6]|uniref:BofC N-terminal domain-containing protein n=1 Tax=Jeotgalibacillus sp. ET6 TaxID=3037260 RepID=UPI002418ACA9|nr:BofC N-terminal domain-containing protein [Jeotgalibacillus sp. ET6]MDG5470931.1 BofC N-terminal domain-containing protein [Jeotgalibacillus sp. ET6]
MIKPVSKVLLAAFAVLLLNGFTYHSVFAEEVHTISVTLETIYEDGDKQVETRTEEVMAMEDFWAKYSAWQLVTMSKEEVVFRSQVEELSPLAIYSGYSTVSP